MSLAIRIIGIRELIDFQLVAQQLNKGYEAREEKMVRYVKASSVSIANFESLEIVQAPREENSHANALASLGSASRKVMRISRSLRRIKY